MLLLTLWCICVHDNFHILLSWQSVDNECWNFDDDIKQERPAVADKPARRERMPKIAPIRRAYNVVADNTGLASFD